MTITLATPAIEVVLDPTHGAEILVVRRPGGANVLATYDWASPVWASRSTTYGRDEADWLSEYRGGWQELFPNAGPPTTVLEVPLPFHGEVSRSTWEVVNAGPASVTLRTPARLPLILERRMTLDPARPVLRVEETVSCDADLAVPFLWGHHPAFAAPAGATIDLPAGVRASVDPTYDPDLPAGDLRPGVQALWPLVKAKDGSAVRLDLVGPGPTDRVVFLDGFPDPAWAAVRGVAPGLGVAMAWDRAAFPCAWNWWQVEGPGHPWHGRARIMAIEPATTWPADGLAAAAALGTAHVVRPGEERTAWLTMALFAADGRPVVAVDREGTVAR